jgi:hypothetical protein
MVFACNLQGIPLILIRVACGKKQIIFCLRLIVTNRIQNRHRERIINALYYR